MSRSEKYFHVSSTLDKYIKTTEKDENLNQFEIRVKSNKETKYYVGYGLFMLQKQDSDCIIIKATGNAIPKAINIVEILKRRVEGLHQINRIKYVKVQDTYEPIEEGLDVVVVDRYLSLIEMTLTKEISHKTKMEPGYQEPLPESEYNRKESQRVRNQVRRLVGRRARGHQWDKRYKSYSVYGRGKRRGGSKANSMSKNYRGRYNNRRNENSRMGKKRRNYQQRGGGGRKGRRPIGADYDSDDERGDRRNNRGGWNNRKYGGGGGSRYHDNDSSYGGGRNEYSHHRGGQGNRRGRGGRRIRGRRDNRSNRGSYRDSYRSHRGNDEETSLSQSFWEGGNNNNMQENPYGGGGGGYNNEGGDNMKEISRRRGARRGGRIGVNLKRGKRRTRGGNRGGGGSRGGGFKEVTRRIRRGGGGGGGSRMSDRMGDSMGGGNSGGGYRRPQRLTNAEVRQREMDRRSIQNRIRSPQRQQEDRLGEIREYRNQDNERRTFNEDNENRRAFEDDEDDDDDFSMD